MGLPEVLTVLPTPARPHVPTRSMRKVRRPCVSEQGHGLRRRLTTRSDCYAFVASSGKTHGLHPNNIDIMLGWLNEVAEM